MSNNKIIIAAGGTGGHLYPGIALAQELKTKGFVSVFLIRRGDIGKEILEKEGLEYFEIPAMGLPRALSLKLLKFPFVFFSGFIAAFSFIKTTKPAVVAGMGGYVSFPAVLCAKMLAIPCVIHEQNALPGLTNRALSYFVDKIAVSFNGSLKYFPPERTIVTGNPIRADLFKTAERETYKELGLSQDKFTILVFGGSQGAEKINSSVIKSFEFLNNLKDKIQFLHISGPKYYEAVRDEYIRRNIPGKVLAYAHNIGDAYAVAGLVICRAGATTVAELKILNKQAALIPFPFASANHQEHNARELEKDGLATVIIEKGLTPGMLAELITGASLSSHTAHYFKMPSRFPQELLAGEIIKLL